MLARRPLRSAVLTGAVAALACALSPAIASADLPWQPCSTAGFDCSSLAVPLDRANPAGEQVTLSVARVKAASNPSNVAVVPLAGGPGQAALPLKQTFASVMQPAIANRDLLVFDQRGTGASGALACKALNQRGSIVKLAENCANEIGPRRAFFRTADSVQDIEALRVAGGYSKLVLFGVSYGTKVAEDYAAAYPQNVEALVLDSVVLPEGPDPFQRSTLVGAPRVLKDLCKGSACNGATDNVTRDLSSLASKLRKKSLRGKVVLSSGKRTSLTMGQNDLLAILLAGDLNPTLRAELPGSMRAALRGDTAPLLRLAVRSEGLTTGLSARGVAHQSEGGGDSDALFLTTTCEEAPFAWTRAAGAEQRYNEVTAAAQAIPKTQLGPFSPAAAVQGGPIPYCLGWPDASPAPAASNALPPVRTLVLDGQMDLRTPYEDAAQIAQRIPGATVVEVPYTGHSTVSADLTENSTCTKTTLATFFAGGTPTPCAASSNPYAPTRKPPTTFGTITAKGKRNKTISAAASTITDAARQMIGDALALGTLPKHVGGLRAGNATIHEDGSFRLNSYQYVKDVVVSGSVDSNRNARITIHGGGALKGSLRISASGRVTGTLGGKKVAISATASAASAGAASLPSIKDVLKTPSLLATR
jgi:pimeloyl-ACP methyl ester carboxylesterase